MVSSHFFSCTDAPVIGHMWETALIGDAIESLYNSQGRCIPPPNAKRRSLPPPVCTVSRLWSLLLPVSLICVRQQRRCR